MIPLPLTRAAQPVKTSGLTDIGTAALLGLIYGAAARSIPILADARINNPNLYDAALGAAVATTVEAMEHDGNGTPRILPGQSQGGIIPPPAWNLM